MASTPRIPSPAALVESLVIAIARSPIVLILGIGLVMAVFNSGKAILGLPWQVHAMPLALIALATLLLFEVVTRLARRDAPLPVRVFLVASLFLGLLLRLVYIATIEPEWYSDFLRYWDYGVAMASQDAISVDNAYGQRAYFLTRPLVEVFGPIESIVPIFNACLLTLIQAIGYDVIRRSRSHQAAQAFSVLWIALPEPLIASTVPTHDLIGLVLTIVPMWLTLFALTRPGRIFGTITIATSVAAGTVIAVLEAARGLGLLYLLVTIALLAATVVVVLCRQGHAGLRNTSVRKAAIIVLIALAAYCIASAAIVRAGATMPAPAAERLLLRYTTPHATSFSDGTYGFMYAFDKTFTGDLAEQPERFREFRRSLVLSDFVDEPLDRLQASMARMERQYFLGSQQSYYVRGLSSKTRIHLYALNMFFVVGFAVLLMVAIYRLSTRTVVAVTCEHFLLLFVATASMSLLLFGENQPRYLFAIWLAGAIVIPSQLSRDETPIRGSISPTWLIVSSATSMLLLATVVFAAAAMNLDHANGRILHEWRFTHDLDDDAAGNAFLSQLQDRDSTIVISRKGDPVSIPFDSLSLKLMLPAPPSRAHEVSAEQQVCDLAIATTVWLEFQYDAPSKHIVGRKAFSLQVAANGRNIWHGILPNPGLPDRVRLPIPTDADGCVWVRFTLLSHGDSPRLSWQHASFVEVFFPRIVAPPVDAPTVLKRVH